MACGTEFRYEMTERPADVRISRLDESHQPTNVLQWSDSRHWQNCEIFYYTAQNIVSAASDLAFEHLDELKGEILLTLLSGVKFTVNSQCSFLYRFIRSARTRRN